MSTHFKYSKLLICVLAITFLFGGCDLVKATKAAGKTFKEKDKEKAVHLPVSGYSESPYNVHVEKSDYSLSLSEPQNGCYLGAYVLSNRLLDFDMNNFDILTEKPHALAVYNMRLGENFPYEWALECVANKKTPYIIVRPPNDYVVFQPNLLEAAAKDFSELYVPIFLDFYPDPHSYTQNPTEYSEYVKAARGIFKEHASNVIFVLSVDSKNVYDFDLFYPGDEYADWVGISIYSPRFIDGEISGRDFMKDLDFFYNMFQQKKPIIISQFAISTFSTADHKYVSSDAAQKLSEFYAAIKNDYKRIKAINYMDFNNIDSAVDENPKDNFSVTQDETLLNSYKRQIADSYFLSETDLSYYESANIQTYRSYFPLLEDKSSKYIPESVFTIELEKLPDCEYLLINGEKYYSTDSLMKSSKISCIIDDSRKTITLK